MIEYHHHGFIKSSQNQFEDGNIVPIVRVTEAGQSSINCPKLIAHN